MKLSLYIAIGVGLLFGLFGPYVWDSLALSDSTRWIWTVVALMGFALMGTAILVGRRSKR